jgi:acetyl esterase/lipase
MNRSFKFCIIGFFLLAVLIVPPAWYIASAITPEFGIMQILQTARVDRDVIYGVNDVPLTMDIYYPTHVNEPMPAVVYVHGGGWYSGDKETGKGKYDIAPLVNSGYVVASINYRLAPRYKFPAQIEDVKCAIRFLRANAPKYNIDSNNIGAYGDSAGGHLVSLLGVTGNSGIFESGENADESDSVQAVVDIYGPTDLPLNFENYNSLVLETIFNTTELDSEILKEGSPVNYVSSNSPPFLIIHGDKDDVVSLEQSQILFEKLATAGVPSQLLVVKNAGHLFTPIGGTVQPSRSEITRDIVDFFNTYLKHI